MGEPALKKIKVEDGVYEMFEDCCRQIEDLKNIFLQKLGSLENKMSLVSTCCNTLVQRIEILETLTKERAPCDTHRHSCCEELLSKLQEMEDSMKSSVVSSNNVTKEASSNSDGSHVVIIRNKAPQVQASVSLDSSFQVITLNNENDYPDGSWLGDELNAELRVRCPISHSDLLHINNFCHTPEKMALTLLDYIFPREVLAVSNLSGKGKHGKRQLDPLMIYGIRCHLLHKFNITERDWYRIKQNMDSKCRTAFRKKSKGLPLGGLKHSSASESQSSPTGMNQVINEDKDSISISTESLISDDGVTTLATEVISTSQGLVKILRATPDQLVCIPESHAIKVLNEEHLLPVLQKHGHFLTSDQVDAPELAEFISEDGTEQTLTIVSVDHIDEEDGSITIQPCDAQDLTAEGTLAEIVNGGSIEGVENFCVAEFKRKDNESKT